jgi:hypothetical protein
MTYLLECGILLLGMDKVEKDIVGAGEDKREEQRKAGQVHVALGAIIIAISFGITLPGIRAAY